MSGGHSVRTAARRVAAGIRPTPRAHGSTPSGRALKRRPKPRPHSLPSPRSHLARATPRLSLARAVPARHCRPELDLELAPRSPSPSAPLEPHHHLRCSGAHLRGLTSSPVRPPSTEIDSASTSRPRLHGRGSPPVHGRSRQGRSHVMSSGSADPDDLTGAPCAYDFSPAMTPAKNNSDPGDSPAHPVASKRKVTNPQQSCKTLQLAT